MTGYLEEIILTLDLILPKKSGYLKTFKDKNTKLMSLRIDADKLGEKYRTIWTKIEDLKII